MPIFVKTMEGKTFTLDMEASDTIAHMKAAIWAFPKAEIPRASWCLIFAGTELEDKRTLSHYNIQQESTILLKLKGHARWSKKAGPSCRPWDSSNTPLRQDTEMAGARHQSG